MWFGCQHEGPATERPALVGRAVRGRDLELIEMPEPVLSGFRNYIGSVAANRDAGTIAVTSPQGNSFAVIEAATAKVLATRALTEVCGVAPDHSGFMVTTGTGTVVEPDGRSTRGRGTRLGQSRAQDRNVKSRRNAGFFFSVSALPRSSGDLLDLLHFGHEVLEQVLDAVLQRRRGRRAAGAGALHVQEHRAVLVAAEGDVAAVLRHRRANARIEQFLDGDDDLRVGLVVELVGEIGLLVIGLAARP